MHPSGQLVVSAELAKNKRDRIQKKHSCTVYREWYDLIEYIISVGLPNVCHWMSTMHSFCVSTPFTPSIARPHSRKCVLKNVMQVFGMSTTGTNVQHKMEKKHENALFVNWTDSIRLFRVMRGWVVDAQWIEIWYELWFEMGTFWTALNRELDWFPWMKSIRNMK